MKPLIIVTLLALSLPLQALADKHLSMAEAEVRKVDIEAKKITLRHGPIANLGMPPMTMVFQVRDTTMLEQVKTGDKIRFSAEKSDGAYILTGIQKNSAADQR